MYKTQRKQNWIYNKCVEKKSNAMYKIYSEKIKNSNVKMKFQNYQKKLYENRFRILDIDTFNLDPK